MSRLKYTASDFEKFNYASEVVHYDKQYPKYTADPKQLVQQLEQLRDSLIGYHELKNHFDTLIDKCTRAMPY